MFKVKVQRFPNDPLCLRVSIGGGRKIGGYYCTYRGTRKEMIEALEAILVAVQHMPELPVEEPPTEGE